MEGVQSQMGWFKALSWDLITVTDSTIFHYYYISCTQSHIQHIHVSQRAQIPVDEIIHQQWEGKKGIAKTQTHFVSISVIWAVYCYKNILNERVWHYHRAIRLVPLRVVWAPKTHKMRQMACDHFWYINFKLWESMSMRCWLNQLCARYLYNTAKPRKGCITKDHSGQKEK